MTPSLSLVFNQNNYNNIHRTFRIGQDKFKRFSHIVTWTSVCNTRTYVCIEYIAKKASSDSFELNQSCFTMQNTLALTVYPGFTSLKTIISVTKAYFSLLSLANANSIRTYFKLFHYWPRKIRTYFKLFHYRHCTHAKSIAHGFQQTYGYISAFPLHISNQSYNKDFLAFSVTKAPYFNYFISQCIATKSSRELICSWIYRMSPNDTLHSDINGHLVWCEFNSIEEIHYKIQDRQNANFQLSSYSTEQGTKQGNIHCNTFVNGWTSLQTQRITKYRLLRNWQVNNSRQQCLQFTVVGDYSLHIHSSSVRKSCIIECICCSGCIYTWTRDGPAS